VNSKEFSVGFGVSGLLGHLFVIEFVLIFCNFSRLLLLNQG